MPKRFHDTDIWDEDWFLNMAADYREFYFYMKDKCDHAGIFKPNILKFNRLFNFNINLEEAIIFFNNGKERVIKLKNGRWFMPDFIPFQYGNHLNTKNRVHASILNILKINEVELTSIRGQKELNDRVKDKDKDKDIYKERIVKGKQNLSDEDFIKKLKETPAYKNINIDNELAKMDAWLLVHKGRQKTRRFIVNWLNKIDKPMDIIAKPNKTNETLGKMKQWEQEATQS
jgi:hypothetical protein